MLLQACFTFIIDCLNPIGQLWGQLRERIDVAAELAILAVTPDPAFVCNVEGS
jgi:hypothetical protein